MLEDAAVFFINGFFHLHAPLAPVTSYHDLPVLARHLWPWYYEIGGGGC
jgi:hypothetical protein